MSDINQLDPSAQYGIAGIVCAFAASLLKVFDLQRQKTRPQTVGNMEVEKWRVEISKAVADRNVRDITPHLARFTDFAERQTDIAEKQTEILQALQRDMNELIAMERARRASA